MLPEVDTGNPIKQQKCSVSFDKGVNKPDNLRMGYESRKAISASHCLERPFPSPVPMYRWAKDIPTSILRSHTGVGIVSQVGVALTTDAKNVLDREAPSLNRITRSNGHEIIFIRWSGQALQPYFGK